MSNYFHFIYKTYNDKGNFYIGRHSTKNLNDGYQGSGNWVKNCKNKGIELQTEILQFASTFEELQFLEEQYILQNITNKFCKIYYKVHQDLRAEKQIPQNQKKREKEEAKIIG